MRLRVIRRQKAGELKIPSCMIAEHLPAKGKPHMPNGKELMK